MPSRNPLNQVEATLYILALFLFGAGMFGIIYWSSPRLTPAADMIIAAGLTLAIHLALWKRLRL